MRTIAERLAGKAAVAQVNTEESPALAARFGVRSIPALFLVKDGRISDRLSGAQSVEAILDWFRRATAVRG